MPDEDNVLFSRQAVDKMINTAMTNKQNEPQNLEKTAKSIAILMGAYNSELKKQNVETPLRRQMVLALQQIMLSK